uniref:COP9 signalosome complex subunit 8 n=1 Tax=Monodelphis domestica TaxID=13616 RepID=A0A5F8GW93_MONDO
MPVAVMADNAAFSFKKLLDQCENQELEAPGGIATPPVYGQLLALYLLHNDMNNARYLWKRIPPAIKSANSELGGIWSVGQRIWQRDFPGIYTTISSHQWSETIQPIMEALRDATRRRAFALVSQAYTSIIADDFAAFVGLPVEEAVKGVLKQGWQADSTTRMVMPKKPGSLDVSFNRFIPLSVSSSTKPIILCTRPNCQGVHALRWKLDIPSAFPFGSEPSWSPQLDSFAFECMRKSDPLGPKSPRRNTFQPSES